MSKTFCGGAIRLSAFATLSFALAGCAGFLPQDAPTAAAVKSNAALITQPTAPLPYVLMPANLNVMRATNSFTDGGGGVFSRLPGGNYRDVTIGVGDIVSVTVYEAQAGGLFIPREAGVRPGNFVDIPRQQVDQSGNINIPYAGAVKVAGLTPRAVSGIIRERLKDRAIDPQVVVAVAEQRGNQVSVLGEVNSPLRFPIDPGGIHLMSAIARSGGPKYPSYETRVTIKRNGGTYEESMSTVVQHPNEDALLRPGDVVYLARIPRVYMVFGSTPSPGAVGGVNNRRFTFENDQMSLAEALAKAGGLDGSRADSRSIYVLRFEPKSMLENLGLDVARFPTKTVPAAYAFDFAKPDGMFLSDTFKMRDRDVIVVSESPATEIVKAMTVLNSVTTNADNISATVAR
ncbi:polysaccharide biosynthesis/export family protein [Bradyrhizobium erythrophlei]|uniref:polysaccharide biosynthesis/export family protein n=1 Tax=Bradyrhizobium erythrophlei TaxID=1437360 RepID=UPI0035E6948C